MMVYGGEGVLDQNQFPKRGKKLFIDRRKNTLQTMRKKLPWPSDKPFKILSLDGGGIRGIYSACILKYIEQIITLGNSVGKYFDLIAGTSTGGIIALALGQSISADNIYKLYANDGKKIFHQKWYWKIPIIKKFHHTSSALYDYRELEKILYREFGDTILGQSTARLVVPAFKGPETEIAVFKTDHHPDFKKDWASTTWEIARATSAAPTYLNGHEYEDAVFLDGGIWANNPVMVAIVDALSSYDISKDQIEILSIGTGNSPFNITLRNAKRGTWKWREVIKGAMFLTTDNAHSQAQLLLGPEKILRLTPSEDVNNIDLDDYKLAISKLPNIAKKDFDQNKELISRFFLDPVAPRDCFYCAV